MKNPNQRKHMSLSLSNIFGRQKKPPHNVSEPSNTQKKSPQNQKINEVILKTMTDEQAAELQEMARIHLNRGALEQQLVELDQRSANNNKKLSENNKKLSENSKKLSENSNKQSANNQVIINARAEQVLGRQMASEGRQMITEARQERIQAEATLTTQVKEFLVNLDEYITYYGALLSELNENDEFFAPLTSILAKIKESQELVKNGKDIKAQTVLTGKLVQQAEAIETKIDSR
jgi:hypothetical protein